MADWRTTNKTLLSKTIFLLESGKFSDLKFTVSLKGEAQTFEAHKCIVAANSSVFESMLFGEEHQKPLSKEILKKDEPVLVEGEGRKTSSEEIISEDDPMLGDGDDQQKSSSNEARSVDNSKGEGDEKKPPSNSIVREGDSLGDEKEKHPCSGEILITDDDPKLFKIMLRYFYSESIILEELEHAINICFIAAKYKVFSLQEKCEEYMVKHLKPEVACRLYEVAYTLNLTSLLESCLSMFSNHTKAVVDSEDFLSSKINTVRVIVEKYSLAVPSESYLFSAVIKWGEKECSKSEKSELREILQPLLSYIRFLYIPPNDLIETSEKYGIPSYEELCPLLIWMTKPNTSLASLPDIFSKQSNAQEKAYKKTSIVYFSARDEQFTETPGKQFSFSLEVKNKYTFIHKFTFPYRAKGRTFSSLPVTISLSAPDRFQQLKFIEELTTDEVYGVCSVKFPRDIFLSPGEVIEITLIFCSEAKGFECKTVVSDGADCQSYMYSKRVGGYKPVDMNDTESISLFIKRVGVSSTTLVIKSVDYEN